MKKWKCAGNISHCPSLKSVTEMSEGDWFLSQIRQRLIVLTFIDTVHGIVLPGVYTWEIKWEKSQSEVLIKKTRRTAIGFDPHCQDASLLSLVME